MSSNKTVQKIEAELDGVTTDRNRVAVAISDLLYQDIAARRKAGGNDADPAYVEWSAEFDAKFSEARAELTLIMGRLRELEAEIAEARGIPSKGSLFEVV